MAAKKGNKSARYEPIPYASEQGIFCGLAGNLNRRSGKLPPSSGNPLSSAIWAAQSDPPRDLEGCREGQRGAPPDWSRSRGPRHAELARRARAATLAIRCFARHRGEGRLDLRISDAGGRRDRLRIGPPDDLQFALAIHLGRIWLVRRSGQDSTAFECRVLAANRNPVADPMPAETMFPLSEPTACCRCPTRPCTLPPEARGGDAVPDHRSLREERARKSRPCSTLPIRRPAMGSGIGR